MVQNTAFEEHTTRYDEWFSKNQGVYAAELKAIETLLPAGDFGIEIGVGTGRFASRLGISIGLEPSNRMGAVARSRGIRVVAGVAEDLPFAAGSFSVALMVTTICFLDDMYKAFRETHRVLRQDGSFLVAFVDRDSPVGQLYEAGKNKSVFYRHATFYTAEEVLEMLGHAGFSGFTCRQTLFRNIAKVSDNEPVLPGYGRGSFVVIRGGK